MKLKGNWRQYIRRVYLVGIVVLFSVGGAVAYMGNAVENPLLIVLGFGGLAGGFMLFLAWRREGGTRHIKGGKEEEDGDHKPFNSLNLYLDRMEFAFVESPKGQSQKCHNDGKYYHVHGVILPGEPEEFRLPDDDESERYYDPTEFANPVTMPSNKKYFTWSASTMQKISVGIMAIIIIAEVIGLIAIGG